MYALYVCIMHVCICIEENSVQYVMRLNCHNQPGRLGHFCGCSDKDSKLSLVKKPWRWVNLQGER